MTQILLVEDDLEICEILQFYLLKQSNYNVTVAQQQGSPDADRAAKL